MLEINKIYEGDCLEQLKTLPSDLIDCCVTSPPYYGLRSYLPEGHPDKVLEIGKEESPEAYVSKLVEVFREVRRVLKDEGTLWLNLGDSFASGGTGGCSPKSTLNGGKGVGESEKLRQMKQSPRKIPNGLKPKDLIGIPWMVAFALRADGWYLRSDIIWHKPNCMPESVTDRPTKSHEYLFLLSKSQKYYYDGEAIKEPCVDDYETWKSKRGQNTKYQDNGQKANHLATSEYSTTGRNRRTVWAIPTKPFTAAHFATFPEALVEPCIKAGTSEKGYCPKCGKAWERQIEAKITGRKDFDGIDRGTDARGTRVRCGESKKRTVGWLPSCQCSCDPQPGIVLDPFFGAGTVGLVSAKLGRRWIGIELNPNYCEIARKRISALPKKLTDFAYK